MQDEGAFDLQPTLVGERLWLRPLCEDDFGALYAVARDPLIWEQHPQSDRWREPVFREYFASGLISGGALLALEHPDGPVIGSSRFHALDAAAGEVEIGWSFLARRCWGGSWNGEMKRLMIAHAFRYVQTVKFRVGLRNLRSQGAMAKIGGVVSGRGLDARGEPCLIYTFTRP